MPSDTITILYFAAARDVTGLRTEVLDIDETATAASVLEAVLARHPRLLPYRTLLRVARNGAFASEDTRIFAGDEVAIIPPVAGG